MSFPSSPTPGQTANLNGITYSYNSTLTAWVRQAVSVVSLGGTGGTSGGLAGGYQGSIPIQSGPGTTSFIPIGSPNQVLITDPSGTTATWATLSSISSGAGVNADNVYINSTTPGTPLYLVLSNGVGGYYALDADTGANAPIYNQTSGLQFNSTLTSTLIVPTNSTATGALTVAGGVGIGGGLYVGGVVTATNFVGRITPNNTSTLQVGYATTAGFAVSFNTSTLVAQAVNLVNTSTTQVGYATTAGYAVSFNTSTLVTSAVTATSAATAYSTIGSHTTGTGIYGNTFNGSTGVQWSLNTSTLMANAVNLVNTSTTQVGSAVTATSAAIAYSLVAGSSFSITNTAGTTSTATGALTVAGGVGIGGSLYVGGTVTATNISHNGLVPTSGLNIDQIYTTSTSLTLTKSWQNVGISGTQLATGSYMVQLLANDSSVGGGEVNTYYTGVMSWWSGATSESSYDEIVLHRAGAASGTGTIFLQVLRAVSGVMNLQISGTTNNTAASTYSFSFRRMI
jgi:hypothetical protein